MQIVFTEGDARRELDVRVNSPAATVDDLARALDPARADRALLVDGRRVDGDLELAEAGLHEGAEVGFGGHRAGADGPLAALAAHAPPGVAGSGPALELVVVSGLDAGRRFPLATGTAVIGRAPGCDVVLPHGTLSRRHAALTVPPGGGLTVEDLGSHNGTWVAGEPVVEPAGLGVGVPLRLGALELEVRRVDAADRPFALDPLRHASAAGTIPFNRPPRSAPAPAPAEVALPAPPSTGQGRVPLSLIGILTPVVFAGVMFAVLRSVHMLLFAGLTPLMGIANAVDAKRRGRRGDRRERDRFRRQVGELRDRLAVLAGEERRRRESLAPDPPEIVRRVELPSVRLWERRPADDDFLHLRVGVGDVPWSPPVARPVAAADEPEELRSVLDDAAVLPGAPVPVDLSGGGVVGIVGHREPAVALARSLLCQAVALHGPADLPVMVLASPAAAPAWDWAKWLPHTRDATGTGRLLSAGPELSARLADARLKAAGEAGDRRRRPPPGARPAGPTLLVVVDDETLIVGRRAPTRNLLRGEGGLVAGIVVASTADRLPAVCTAVVEVTDASGVVDLVLPQAGRDVRDVAPAGMADDVSRSCARALARFEDPELDVVGAGLPAGIRLLPLLELEDCTAEAVLARWKA
ncbi:MAG TPA: FHA domain-containing protein, partial [Acidimicrobiales bacterium]